jgi:hypothetical protein
VFGAFGDGKHLGIDRLLAGPHGLLAVGSSGSRVITWASRDGVHWRRGAATAFTSDEGLSLRVTAWQQGWVGLSDQGGETVVWSSSDGLTWTRVGSDELFGGTATVISVTGFKGGVAAVGSFAPHPQPACLSTTTLGDLRTFRPATFLWSPRQSRSAPPPRVDPSDPRTLKLLPADIPPSLFHPFSGGPYQGAYVNLCREDPALGQHRAYHLIFASDFYGQALSIVAASVPAAQAAFQQGDQLVFSADPDITILRKPEVPAPVRIGEKTRLFQLQVKEQICDDAMAFVRDLQCSDEYYQPFAVVWRQGRVIGEVVVGCPLSVPPPPASGARLLAPPSCNAPNLATRLAQKQLAHLRHPSG